MILWIRFCLIFITPISNGEIRSPIISVLINLRIECCQRRLHCLFVLSLILNFRKSLISNLKMIRLILIGYFLRHLILTKRSKPWIHFGDIRLVLLTNFKMRCFYRYNLLFYNIPLRWVVFYVGLFMLSNWFGRKSWFVVVNSFFYIPNSKCDLADSTLTKLATRPLS